MRVHIPNILSLFRLCLVPLLLVCPPYWRIVLLLLGALSDFFDGFLARKWSVSSKLGAFLDPFADKAVVLAFSYLFWKEGALVVFELCAIFARDVALIFFVLSAFVFGYYRHIVVKSFWCGKIATALQCVLFAFLCIGMPVPIVLYFSLFGAALLAIPELFWKL